MESPRTLVDGPGEPAAGEDPTRLAPARPGPSPFRARRIPGPGAEGEQTLVLGRYALLERLGSGGFGVVWRARDEMLGREVAVKRILLGPDGDPDRAAREAQASARLAHPAIVALYEACAEGEAFYLISELVHGETLARLIAEDDLDDERIVAIGLALAEALAHAHARGVIHRDVKPQNVLIPDAGDQDAEHSVAAKLTDFGGAAIAEEEALTRTGDVLGTLAYMAPEQSEGRELDERVDLYALALVLYEAFSGANPVRGATPAATARAIGSRLVPLRRVRRDLPQGLCAAIDRALAPAPRDRGTVEDLRAALHEASVGAGGRAARTRVAVPQPRAPRWADDPPPAARPARGAAGATAEQPAREAPAEARLELPHRGLPRVFWAALALGLAIWQLTAGRPGVALVALAALLPLALMPSAGPWGGVSAVWLGALLAPVLGLAGLAAAYPSVAGQARRWTERLLLGALGYWWLTLAGPLLARRLWLGAAPGTPARTVWEPSLASSASHVIAPMLTAGVLAGALLWGAGALVLPWVVRGRSAAADLLAACAWSVALVLATPRLDAGLAAGAHPMPRGLVLGALLGAMIAVGARALRGPV